MRLASKASLTPLLVQWVGKRCCLLPESITTGRMQCKLQLHGRLFPCAVSMHLHPKEGRKHVQGREVWQVQPKFLMSFPSDPSNVYEVRLSGSIAHLSSMAVTLPLTVIRLVSWHFTKRSRKFRGTFVVQRRPSVCTGMPYTVVYVYGGTETYVYTR